MPNSWTALLSLPPLDECILRVLWPTEVPFLREIDLSEGWLGVERERRSCGFLGFLGFLDPSSSSLPFLGSEGPRPHVRGGGGQVRARALLASLLPQRNFREKALVLTHVPLLTARNTTAPNTLVS